MSRFGSRSRVSTYLSDWMPTGDDDPKITVDYLVLAGGGGGGTLGGGGGAGGLRSTVTATGGGGTLETAIVVSMNGVTVTVGAGGAVWY
jgi:hypothetical protein